MSNDCRGLNTLFRGLPAPETQAFEMLVTFCDKNPVAVRSALPFAAAEVSNNSGFERFFRFVLDHSGANIYISQDRGRFNAKYDLSLSEAEHRRLLDSTDARGTISVPSAFGVFIALRRSAMLAEIKAGRPDREIARTLGASIRAVKQERRRARDFQLTGNGPSANTWS
ncbi:hypothetical protein EV659_101178 [Rhodothalassium salexigens DSM 2132]|uniref:Uncharacterized protein n=1 Tax=Rhodothalassium salexigens DSM 2132 TaxID=1188247 RepID=A0A4R2PR32_RHOSA|nr:hypothetical protein [Rhodothalassium salexigens DSM 2132]TCP38280.1 hypothetical protein EV659_101178 [Rhodothalassium salexigens DSM 2132]